MASEKKNNAIQTIVVEMSIIEKMIPTKEKKKSPIKTFFLPRPVSQIKKEKI